MAEHSPPEPTTTAPADDIHLTTYSRFKTSFTKLVGNGHMTCRSTGGGDCRCIKTNGVHWYDTVEIRITVCRIDATSSTVLASPLSSISSWQDVELTGRFAGLANNKGVLVYDLEEQDKVYSTQKTVIDM